MPTPSEEPPMDESEDSDHAWPKDIVILAIVVVVLWVITLIWSMLDLSQLLFPIHSEEEAWGYALSGLLSIFVIFIGIAASWGAILGIATCLLVTNLSLYRLNTKVRWIWAAGVTMVVFLGIPIVLNHNEERRLAAEFQRDDTIASGSVQGRAVELPSKHALSWNCDHQCLDLLTFGGAKTVTVSFPGSKVPPKADPAVATYVLVQWRKSGCSGETFRDVCPYQIEDERLPENPLVLELEPVALPRAASHTVLARRLTVKDMARAARSATTQTRFVFAHYSPILNLTWGKDGFYIPREQMPIFPERDLDRDLVRDFISSSIS